MSVIVIDPSARNLPEQVLKNTQDLNELQTAIDELTKVLPDIMGRSPATYVAPVALDSEAKPAGQYHLLFANTSYDVKNGDYVFCVFVHAASGNSYVGVLQVVNDAYASGQYAATVTAVTPNLRGNDGAAGQQGQPGEAGADGEAALVYSQPVFAGIVPTNGSQVMLGTNNFNRTPKANDTVSLVVIYGSSERSFIALAKIISYGTTLCTAQYTAVIETTGATGPASELYLHRIEINTTAAAPWPHIYTEIINTSATPFDMNSLTSLIEGKKQVANGIATGTEPLFTNLVLYIYSNNSVLYAKTAYANDVALSRESVTIVDTVEEI